MSTASEVIRFSDDGGVNIVWDTSSEAPVRVPTQHDLDTLPVGDDLTDDDIARLDD